MDGGVQTVDERGEPRHYSHEEYEQASGRLARMWYEEGVWAQRVDPDFQFEVGRKYLTLEGKVVTIVEKTGPTDEEGRSLRGYECVRGSDGVWRYNRSGKFSNFVAPDGLGRTTGSPWHRLTNLIPVAIDEGQEEYVWRWRWASGGAWRYTSTDEEPDLSLQHSQIAPVEVQRVRVTP